MNRHSVFLLLYVIVICPIKDVLCEEFGDSLTSHFKNTYQQTESKGPCSQCPHSGTCVPRIQCPAHLRPASSNPECYLLDKHIGICCYTGNRHASEDDLIVHGRDSGLKEEDLKAANKISKKKIIKLLNQTKYISELPEAVIDENTPDFGHHLSQINYDARVPVLGKGGLRNMLTTKELRTRDAITSDELNLGLTFHTDSPFCPENPVCVSQPSRFRTLGGECNNAKHPRWGAVNTAFERLLPPAYHDGTWSMRRSVVNQPLRSARTISSVMFEDVTRPSSKLNMMFVQFGQFIAHDVSATVMFTIGNGSSIACCSKNGEAVLPPEMRHHACAPISIDDRDEFYGLYRQRCFNFVRAQLAPSSDCKIGYANQMNGATHFLDLSHVYGSTMEKTAELRGPRGELKVFRDYGRQMLPLTNRKECVDTNKDAVCFNTGDHHGNQIISLTIFHTIWMREHNRVARELSEMNPVMDDDDVFMEARRIVQAEFQHIVYNEWLPLVLGPRVMEMFNLKPQPSGYVDGYDPELNPSITAEFASAAMRFGHSTVDGKLMAVSYLTHQMLEAVRIPDVMFRPNRLRIKDYIDSMIVGITWQPMQEVDTFIDDTLTHYLFHGGKPFGLDLASINIQRSRDFGIRSYNDYRRLIGLRPILEFHKFPEKDGENLQLVYSDPEDVDLYVGGLTEPHVHGGIVGPMFAEIIADQFSRLKRGDRYYYEYGPATNPGAFTQAQLREIKKVTFTRILCDNSDALELVAHPVHSFLRSDFAGNKITHCRGGNIPEMDMSKFSTSINLF